MHRRAGESSGFYRQPGQGLVIPILYSGDRNLRQTLAPGSYATKTHHNGEAFLRSGTPLDFEKEMLTSRTT
jgi:hypothetical protein